MQLLVDLILFFLGYFGVVLYGKPDIIIASVLSEIVK